MNSKRQAVRWFVAAATGDSCACAERALDLGFQPDWLATYSHTERCFVQTPEKLLVIAAISHLNNTGECPGPVVLREWIAEAERRNQVEPFVAAQMTAVLEDINTVPLNLGDVEPVVRSLHGQYKLGLIYAGLHGAVEQLRVAPPDVIAQALRHVADSVEVGGNGQAKIYSLSDVAEARWREYEAREADETMARGVMLGWLAFDERNNGVRPGELLVVVANTNVGKSAFCLRSALNAWRLGRYNVMLINKEMSTRVQHQRMEAMELSTLLRERVDVNDLVSRIEMGKLDGDLRDLYRQVLDSYRSNPAQCWIVPPNAYRDLNDLEALVARYKRRYGLNLLVVDSLNLQRNHNARYERHDLVLGDTAVVLHDIAVRYDVAVITDAQSPRDIARKQQVSIEEAVGYSAMIAQTADTLIRLFRPEKHFLEAQVLKARSGEAGYSFHLYFDPSNMRIEYVMETGA